MLNEQYKAITESYFLDKRGILAPLYTAYHLPGPVDHILPDGWDMPSRNVSQSLPKWLKAGSRYDTVVLSARTGVWIPGRRTLAKLTPREAVWDTDSHLEFAGERCVLANELVCVTRNDAWRRVAMYVHID